MRAQRWLAKWFPSVQTSRTRVHHISPAASNFHLDGVVPNSMVDEQQNQSEHQQQCCHQFCHRCGNDISSPPADEFSTDQRSRTCPCNPSLQRRQHNMGSSNHLAHEQDLMEALNGVWEMKECHAAVIEGIHEFIIAGDTLTTATGNQHKIKHGYRRGTVRFADAVGELCEDGVFILKSSFGTYVVYHRVDLPDAEILSPLEGQWFWQDKRRPCDTSLLTIRGSSWHIQNGKNIGCGWLHFRTRDGAVTLRTCPIRRFSKDCLVLCLPTGKTFRYTRNHRHTLYAVPEDSTLTVTM